MMQANVASQSRWVLRVLWLIAGMLAITILSIRDSNILSQSRQMLEGFRSSAAQSFSVPSAPRSVPHSLDALTWPDHAPVLVRPGVVATVAAGTPLTVSGWAFDTDANAPFAGIGAKIDDGPDTAYGMINLPRTDVAAALRNPGAEKSGFSTVIDTTNLALGHHAITLRALAPDRKSAVALGTIEFAVGRANLKEQKTDSIDAINGIIVDAAASAKSPIAITRSARRITLTGWGFITQDRRLASNAVLLLDGNPVAPARYGLSRSYVATAYHDVRLTRSGFEATLSLDALQYGAHTVQLRMGSTDGKTVDSMTTLHIDVRGYL